MEPLSTKAPNGIEPWYWPSLRLRRFFSPILRLRVTAGIALVVAPVLAGLLGWRRLRWRGVLGACVLIGVVGLGAWLAFPNFQTRLNNSIEEFHRYRATNERNQIAEHVAYLMGSLAIIASAPIIGHGTGSIHNEFRRVTAGKTGAAGLAADNPHNQSFAVAIQLGLLGGLALWSMWLAHLMLFRGKSLTAWIGLIVVVENIVSSTVHSHLFDFNNGWLYAFGVGVLGGTSLRERAELSKTIKSSLDMQCRWLHRMPVTAHTVLFGGRPTTIRLDILKSGAEHLDGHPIVVTVTLRAQFWADRRGRQR